MTREEIDIGREIEHVLRCAAAGQTRVIRLAPLVFFSIPGSAWVLDVEDSLACCLMDDGRRRPTPLRGESRARYALEWECEFAVRDGCLWTFGREGPMLGHHSVPAEAVEDAVRAARRQLRR